MTEKSALGYLVKRKSHSRRWYKWSKLLCMERTECWSFQTANRTLLRKDLGFCLSPQDNHCDTFERRNSRKMIALQWISWELGLLQRTNIEHEDSIKCNCWMALLCIYSVIRNQQGDEEGKSLLSIKAFCGPSQLMSVSRQHFSWRLGTQKAVVPLSQSSKSVLSLRLKGPHLHPSGVNAFLTGWEERMAATWDLALKQHKCGGGGVGHLPLH